MKVAIVGSRTFNDSHQLARELQGLNITEVISGKARGADTLGEEWAQERGVPVTEMPAQWDLHGRKAGPLRNEEMAQRADLVVAFWDGASPGTKHMINACLRRKVPVNVRFF